MNVAVFGLGYVGSVTAACLARDGHRVIGVDTNPNKVATVEQGLSPVLEPGLDSLISQCVGSGRLSATTNASAAVKQSDLSLICVGTPSGRNGSLDLSYVENVAQEIGAALKARSSYHTVVIRSTVLPSTTVETVIPRLEESSGKLAGAYFGVAMNPEFLREGTALADFDRPSMVIIGALDERSYDQTAALYSGLLAPIVRTDLTTAEMVKYTSNAFHALKVAFANEIGRISKAHGVDGQRLMEIFRLDTQLNVSGAYLNPGNAFGGSCLPKDTRALAYRAVERDIDAPLLKAVLSSNREHLETTIRMVESHGRRRIGVLGLSFKAGTDDVRESPSVTLIETLLGRGFDVRVHDPQVELNRLVGSNKSFLESELPHIAQHLCPTLDELVDCCDVLVLTQSSPAHRNLAYRLRDDQVLIDLVGVAKPTDEVRGYYDGICW